MALQKDSRPPESRKLSGWDCGNDSLFCELRSLYTDFKYTLEKRLRLAAGRYKIFFGLPEEKYFTEAEITLKDGEMHVMEYKPVYRHKTSPTRIRSFLKGIDTYEVFFDGNKFF